MTKKTTVAVLFGGRSEEHEISILSTRNVLSALDPKRYSILPVYIDRQGVWSLIELDETHNLPEKVTTSRWQIGMMPANRGQFLALSHEGTCRILPATDVVFPVLHGLYGEDGTVQGMAELMGLPYVGCSVAASSAAMDKDMAKALLRDAGLAVARSKTFYVHDPMPDYAQLARELGKTLFIKPARQGSSVGVAKAGNAREFVSALRQAFQHDSKVLVEEFVPAREIECAILQDADGTLTVSVPGEIIPASKHGFYSYDAKYIDAEGASVVIPAKINQELAVRLTELATKAFRALCCEGMARVDFFLRPNGDFLVNELNTIPGFTNISLYPKALAISGIGNRELVDRLIAHALERGKGNARV